MAAGQKAGFCVGCPVGGRFNKVDQTCSEVDPADGLPVACVGEWVEEKHARLRKYVDISWAARRKFLGGDGATYIDLFCGPGRARIRRSTRIVDGSSLVAVSEAQRTNTSFSTIHVADLNPGFVAASTQRLRAVGVKVSAHAGPSATTVVDVVRSVPPRGLHFAFLDPYDLRTLPFSVIHELANLQRIDLMIHVSVQDLQRNLGRYIRAQASPLDAFAPGWREAATEPSKEIEKRHRILAHWLASIRRENLDASQGVELVTGSKDQPLYWLVFAARHDLAIKFWEEIRNVQQQRTLDL